MNKKINQKILSLIEYYNLLNMDLLINNSPINAENISEFYTMEDFKGKRTLQEFEYSNYYSDCFVDYNQ